jgi:hypothetical protein
MTQPTVAANGSLLDGASDILRPRSMFQYHTHLRPFRTSRSRKTCDGRREGRGEVNKGVMPEKLLSASLNRGTGSR